MRRDKIIEQLSIVNKKLKQGVLGNPAHIEDGNLIFHGTLQETKEVLALIGDWSYKLESKKVSDLRLQKTLLEAELKVTFDEFNHK